MTDLVTTTDSTTNLPAKFIEAAQEFASKSKAASTLRVYGTSWRIFMAWCRVHEQVPLPASPETVAVFIAHRASTVSVSTLERDLAAIHNAHQLAQVESPTGGVHVRSVMAGVRRTLGVAAKGKKPVLVRDLRRIVAQLPGDIRGQRDHAVLLLGFAGALRRSEVVGLDLDDLDFQEEGLVITLKRSKTDQVGAGESKGIPYGSNPMTCPVRAVRRWVDAGGIECGPVFRPVGPDGVVGDTRLSGRSVGLLVKRAVQRIGLDPDQYGGHSLRAGLATSAAMKGVSQAAIMRQTGHKSLTTLMGYIRHGSLFLDNAAAQLGL